MPIDPDAMQLAPESLPPSIQAVAEVVGLPATLRIVESYGGIRLWVPKTIGEDHELMQLIGRDQAMSLVSVFGGEVLSVPRCASAIRELRDEAIREARSAGEPVAKLARRHGLTERQVFTILQRERASSAQQSLI